MLYDANGFAPRPTGAGLLPLTLAALSSTVRGACIALSILVHASAEASEPCAEFGRENVLAGARYTLSPAPTMANAADKARTVLTDCRGGAWLFADESQAAGWTLRSPVFVRFALLAATSIDTVRVTALENTRSQRYAPAQFFVYGGDGYNGFQFLGASKVDPAARGSYLFAHDTTDIVVEPRPVKELILVVFPRGAHTMLAEVEARRASRPAASGFVVEGRGEEELLKDVGRRRRAAVDALPLPKPTGSAPYYRWAMVLDERALGDVGDRCTIERVDPWERGTHVDDPTLAALIGGYDYAMWRIRNGKRSSVRVEATPKMPGDLHASLFNISYVQALDYTWVPDAVTPYAAFDLAAGSEAFMLAELSPTSAGVFDGIVQIDCGDTRLTQKLNAVAITPKPNVGPVHGNLWAMLHQANYKVVRDAIACEPNILRRLGLTTAVLHPNAIYPGDTGRPTALLRDYFRAFRNMDRLLVYMWGSGQRWPFLDLPDQEAVEWLRDWWGWIKKTAAEEGYQGELVLYPVDEPRGDGLKVLKDMARLIRLADLGARLYVTWENTDASEAAPEFDIIQYAPKAARLSLPATHRVELHHYDATGDARLLSPNGYYRTQGWRALQLGLAGVGVWSVWDTSGVDVPLAGWSPFGGSEHDYGMLYESPDGCGWPSIRLLAWRRGIEENRMLRTCGIATYAQGLQETSNQLSARVQRVAAACRS